MPKRTYGPFPALQGLPSIDLAAAYSGTGDAAAAESLLDRMQLLHDTLESAGCHCNGHAAGLERDSDWGDDISELVLRCTPHDVQAVDRDGNPTTSRVYIELGTLRVEIDSNNEICAWLYEEPEVESI